MPKDSFYFYECRVCVDGYVIEPHPMRLALRKTKPRIPTVLNNPDDMPEKVIRPLSDNYKTFNVFEEKGYRASRIFSKVYNPDTKTLDEDLLIKFVSKYGLIGTSPDGLPEDLDSLRSLAWTFYHIYSFSKENDKIGHAKAIAFCNTLSSPVKPMIIPDIKENSSTITSRNQSHLHFKASSLVGAMQIMAAHHLALGVELQKCANPTCMEWFPRKSNKKVCSGACRIARFRKNKSK